MDQLVQHLATKNELSHSSQSINTSLTQQVGKTKLDTTVQFQNLDMKLAQLKAGIESIAAQVYEVKAQVQAEQAGTARFKEISTPP